MASQLTPENRITEYREGVNGEPLRSLDIAVTPERRGLTGATAESQCNDAGDGSIPASMPTTGRDGVNTHPGYSVSGDNSTEHTQCAIYVRVSTAEQATEGNSLDAQLAALRAYAKMKGWTVFDEYVDGGYSGGTDERPALRRLVHDAKGGYFRVVLVAKLDRFFRNLRLLLNYLQSLNEYGVSFVSVSESLDTGAPTGKFTLHVLGIVAEFERERISERLKDTRRHLAGLHRWSSGRTPYGYRFNKATKGLETYEPEAEAVRFAFHTYVKEHLGVQRLAERMNAECLPTPRMGRRKHTTWTISAVKHMLRHPGYAGGPNDAWPFDCPAIIPAELWQSAQEQLSTRRRFNAVTKSQAKFRGKLYCGLCGHALRNGYSHNETEVYVCPGRTKALHLDGSPRCTLPRVEVKKLDESMLRQIDEICSSPEVFLEHFERTIKSLDVEQEEAERKLRPIGSEVARIKEDMAILDARLEVRRITPQEYKARVRELEGKLRSLRRREEECEPVWSAKLDSIKIIKMRMSMCLDIIRKASREFGMECRDTLIKGFKLYEVDKTLGYPAGSYVNEAEYSTYQSAYGAISDNGIKMSVAGRAIGVLYPDKVEIKTSINARQLKDSSGYGREFALPLNIRLELPQC